MIHNKRQWRVKKIAYILALHVEIVGDGGKNALGTVCKKEELSHLT